jgi:hypothetical protein
VPGPAPPACSAVAAGRSPVENHEVTGSYIGNSLAHGLDDACRLVTQQEREIVVDRADFVVEIGVAHAAGLDVDDRLAGPRIRHHDSCELDRLTLRACHDSLDLLGHDSSLSLV